MPPKQHHPELFDVGPRRTRRRGKTVRPYWTENKAALIERYLRQFLFVTKHGTYLDGFAGPQEEDVTSENWAARLVLKLTPLWLRHFVLFEEDADQVKRIHEMLHELPKTPLGKKMRDIKVRPGDVNVVLPRYLSDYPIKAKEATFCLLDQRTFECHWATVDEVSQHKRGGHKIEIFYFLANAWIQRSFATTKDKAKLEAWWGRADWRRAAELKGWDLALEMQARFVKELGYQHVKPYPIFNRLGGRKIMYFMIHATDHPDAPDLMDRSYDHAVERVETQEEIQDVIRAFRKARGEAGDA